MNEPRITMNFNDVRLSPHFFLSEFLNAEKYPDNKPTMQHVANMTYGWIIQNRPAFFISFLVFPVHLWLVGFLGQQPV